MQFDFLFPAWAGVIPLPTPASLRVMPFPRMGGGDPDLNRAMSSVGNFSPHGRG